MPDPSASTGNTGSIGLVAVAAEDFPRRPLGCRDHGSIRRPFGSSDLLSNAGTTEVSAYPPSPRGTARTSQMLPGRHPTPDPLRIVGRTGSPLVAPRKCAEPICQPRDADYYRDHTKVLFISCLRRASWPIESSQILTNSSL